MNWILIHGKNKYELDAIKNLWERVSCQEILVKFENLRAIFRIYQRKKEIMSIYLGRFAYFETINQHLKTTQLLNPLLIIYKAQCTTTTICNTESVGTCTSIALNSAAKSFDLVFTAKI